MNRTIVKTIRLGTFALIVTLTAAWLMQTRNAQAQDAKSPYPSMAFQRVDQ